ncbi:MAG: hypothetical protein GXP05_16100 [Alphaproteobacteria bacterium]|nr:hypothetical protein [Alphaproteobacteria bacterium]
MAQYFGGENGALQTPTARSRVLTAWSKDMDDDNQRLNVSVSIFGCGHPGQFEIYARDEAAGGRRHANATCTVLIVDGA